MAVVCVDCRCSLSFVFLGGARRLGLSPCNTVLWTVIMGDICDACRLRRAGVVRLLVLSSRQLLCCTHMHMWEPLCHCLLSLPASGMEQGAALQVTIQGTCRLGHGR